MHFFNIKANYNFLGSLYSFIYDNFEDNIDISAMTIILPSRRAVNAFKMVFFEKSGSAVNILPVLRAMGDVDDESILLNNVNYSIFKDHIGSAKIVSHLRYRLLLLDEILDGDSSLTIEQAINLTKELDLFMTDVEKYEINFSNLDNIVDDNFALHWQQILQFLKKFGEKWQNLLAKNNITSTVGNIIANIKFYANIFEHNRPKNPLLLAGNFDFFKSTVDFIRALSKHDNTYLLFKGLENILTDEEFDGIDEYHSHYHFKKILRELNITRESVESIEYENYREISDSSMYTLYSSALPSNLTYRWQKNGKITELAHIRYLECNDDYDECAMVTMYLLDYVANNGLKNVAVIVDLEQSYKMELFLRHWNLPYNNVYGKKIISHAIVRYLLLLIDLYNSNYRQDRLLSLLKHHFTHFGYSKEELLTNIEIFENNVLAGGNNKEGMKFYRKNIENNVSNIAVKQKLWSMLDKIENCFSVLGKRFSSLSELIEEHLGLAEKIAGSDTVSGADALWHSNDDGEKIFKFFREELLPQSEHFKNMSIGNYSRVFSFLISEKSYSNDYSIHPTINLISMGEARLIDYDLVIIANLNEGSIPKNVPADPWLSRKMRIDFGLPAREASVGSSYFDFIQLMAQKNVLLVRSKIVSGVTTLKSRFLQRLETTLECNGFALVKEQWLVKTFGKYYSFSFDSRNEIYKRRPQPKPPCYVRPRKLSVTNINLLALNPYDIYAKKILGLSKKNILTSDSVYARIGTLMHGVFEQYCNCYEIYRQDKLKNLMVLVQEFLGKYFTYDQIYAELYFNRAMGIARCFLDFDSRSREQDYSIAAESWNSYTLLDKNFTISARIDRIETQSSTLRIIDYKTGTAPSKGDILNGRELQLPLEALILAHNRIAVNIRSLQYWLVKHRDGKIIGIDSGEKIRGTPDVVSIDKLIAKTEEFVVKLIDFFDNETNGYLATNRNAQHSDFNHLSRVEEWLYEPKTDR
ncbi:MAG: PD-(D/E)XK nuclease family protein [Rickettsiales bacterium]|jgi:ATP-dependent helicase/nuclease subunit B|nr:PD-(D/E)XK nuclease family protein [Rickettsiales bacterium]